MGASQMEETNNAFFLDRHQSPQLDQLFVALSKAQEEMDAAYKTKNNPFFKSRYADLGEIVGAARPALCKNGLSVMQQIVSWDGVHYLTTTVGHASGQWMRSCMAVNPLKDDIQSLGSAITYLRRYCYASLMGVIVEDDDGEAAVNRNSNQTPNQYKAQPVYQKSIAQHEVITLEQYDQLVYEISEHDDIAEKVLAAYNIDSLKHVPKAMFMKVIEAVRNNKNAKKKS